MVHRNFESTEEIVSNLQEMESKLYSIEHMLIEDSSQLDGPAPDLLLIHYHLNQLERFRNDITMEARKASKTAQEMLARRFDRLNTVTAQFDGYFGALAENILPLVKAGYSDVVVRLVKIAEVEEREDEKVGPSSISRRALLNPELSRL
jgi:exocyst complex component 3